MSYTEQMSGRGLGVSSRVLSLGIIHTEQEIAARLSLPATSRLVKLERLRLGGDEPFAIETCYFSADEFAGLTRARLDRFSLFSLLEHDYGLQIAHADEEVDATTADAHSARLLGIPVGAAVLRIRQKIYSTRGRPALLHVLGLYRSDRHSLFHSQVPAENFLSASIKTGPSLSFQAHASSNTQFRSHEFGQTVMFHRRKRLAAPMFGALVAYRWK